MTESTTTNNSKDNNNSEHSDSTEQGGTHCAVVNAAAGNLEQQQQQHANASKNSTKGGGLRSEDVEQGGAGSSSSSPPPRHHLNDNNNRIGKIYRTTLSRSGRQKIRTVPSAHDDLVPPPVVVAAADAEAAPDDAAEDATWGDVARACCCHNQKEWMSLSMGVFWLFFFLYFFLVGLDWLGTSFKVVGGCTAGSMLGSDTNPLASVMIGIIATTLLQSSSTTTSIVVSLVGGGLDVQQGIYLVMGANVGTSVTSMIVSLAHMGDGEELERAFAGSSVNYMFKLLSVIILLPLEISVHYLYELTKAMLPSSAGDEGESWEGPIKQIVAPLTDTIIIANKDLIEEISTGEVESCNSYYPVQCNGTASHANCREGLIGCNKDTGKCPAFFQEGASKEDDIVSGWVCLVMALALLIFCLVGLVALLRRMLFGASTKIIYKATNINDYVGMVIGCGVTILVQSSSITTSTLVPLAGIGVLKIEQIYPLTLGADIGTTFTALMAAMVSSKIESLQIALAHLFFNLTGILLWYPIPFLRRIPINAARKLGKVTRHWRAFPLLFIVVVFVLAPLLLLGISSCFEKGTRGFRALGVFLMLLIGGGMLYFWFWWRFRNGKQSCQSCIRRRQRRAAALEHLAEDLDYLKCDIEYAKNEIGRLKDYAGLPIGTSPVLPRPDESEQLLSDEDDALSMFQSCQSKPWQDVLIMASQSVRDSLHGAGSVGWSLGSSTRSRRRHGGSTSAWALGSSTRSKPRNASAFSS